MILLGLTGKRRTGKSALADHLVDHFGFARMHPFDGGKAATRAYFRHLGASQEMAQRMVDGDLKDKPSALLPPSPTGEHFSPRFFQEKFGAFMGVTLGPDWTIGYEIDRLRGAGVPAVVSESIAFEAREFRAAGGIIIRIEREHAESSIIGVETDPVVDDIVPDLVFRNDAADAAAAGKQFLIFLEANGLLGSLAPEHDCPEPA